MSGSLVTVGIDPGNEYTALVVWDGQKVLYKTKAPNDSVRNWILSDLDAFGAKVVAIETIQSFGMAVGKSVFETCQWIGHFLEALSHTEPKAILKVKRNRIKIHHCKTTKSNDSAVRAALIARFGQPGTKKAPGVTYGVTADMWSGLALASWGYDVVTNGAPRAAKGAKK